MRLWSIHPSYLDSKGLVACWSESLLARSVLLGLTKGYKNHPQLYRFKQLDYKSSRWILESYLFYLLCEAEKRGYNFDRNKLDIKIFSELYPNKITVTKGQLIYEFNHLQDKLYIRDKKKYNENFELIKHSAENIQTHPLFKVVYGEVEQWEKIK